MTWQSPDTDPPPDPEWAWCSPRSVEVLAICSTGEYFVASVRFADPDDPETWPREWYTGDCYRIHPIAWMFLPPHHTEPHA